MPSHFFDSMATVYSIAFAVVGIILAHACTLIWAALLLPGPTERARKRLESRPLVCFFIGLVGCLVTIAVMLLYLRFRDVQIQWLSQALDYLKDHIHAPRFYNDAWVIVNDVAYLFAAPAMAGLIVGGAAFSMLFAVRARPMMREDRPLAGLAYGAICTSAAYFLPMVGWFVFLPIVGLMSVGAGLWGILSRGDPRSLSSGAVANREEHSRAGR